MWKILCMTLMIFLAGCSTTPSQTSAVSITTPTPLPPTDVVMMSVSPTPTVNLTSTPKLSNTSILTSTFESTSEAVKITPSREYRCEETRFFEFESFEVPSGTTMILNQQKYYPSPPYTARIFNNETFTDNPVVSLEGFAVHYEKDWYLDFRDDKDTKNEEIWLVSVITGEARFIADYPENLRICFVGNGYIGFCKDLREGPVTTSIADDFRIIPVLLINIENENISDLPEFSVPENYSGFLFAFFYEQHFYFVFYADGFYIHDFSDGQTRKAFSWLDDYYFESYLIDKTPDALTFEDGKFFIFAGGYHEIMKFSIIPFDSAFKDLTDEEAFDYQIAMPDSLEGQKNFVFWDQTNSRIGFTTDIPSTMFGPRRGFFVYDINSEVIISYCLDQFTFLKTDDDWQYIYYLSDETDDIDLMGTFIMDLETGNNTQIIGEYIFDWIMND